MVYRNLDLFSDVGYPIESVVKVDDTVGGVGEGLNAGCWSVGVTRYSNYMNINSYEEEAELSDDEINSRLQHSRKVLEGSGAHYLVDTLEQLPLVIDDINRRLARGQTPGVATVGKAYYSN